MATDQQASANPGSAGSVSGAATPSLVQQLIRFALIGGFCFLIDTGVYWLGLQVGLWVHLAKGIGFIAGTTTAYFLNKKFTFNASGSGGAAQIGGFVLLYTVTFFVNVGTNALMLALLPTSKLEYPIAVVVAQATSTLINFVMLKLVIFRDKPADAAVEPTDT